MAGNIFRPPKVKGENVNGDSEMLGSPITLSKTGPGSGFQIAGHGRHFVQGSEDRRV